MNVREGRHTDDGGTGLATRGDRDLFLGGPGSSTIELSPHPLDAASTHWRENPHWTLGLRAPRLLQDRAPATDGPTLDHELAS